MSCVLPSIGRRLSAVGQNRAAAALAGIANARCRLGLHPVLAAGVDDRRSARRLHRRCVPGMGQPYLLQSVAAVVLGGTLIFGGAATAVGTFLASILLILIVTTMQILGLPPGAQDMVQGGRDPRAGARRPRARNPPQTSRGRPRRHRHAGRLMQPRCAVGRVAPARCDINGIGFGSCPGDDKPIGLQDKKRARSSMVTVDGSASPADPSVTGSVMGFPAHEGGPVRSARSMPGRTR